MGLLSWFFPSATDRITTARKMMSAGRWGDARLELLETFPITCRPLQSVAGAGDFGEEITMEDELVFIIIDEEQPDR